MRLFLTALLAVSLPRALPASGTPTTVADLLHELRAFEQTGRVLYVAAHPDDENTRLIAYLARGRGYRTGYLSLTRGDGGQNLIGTELRDALGVIRTQELLAARRIDGGVQFFTRANDFGFSKTSEESLEIWDHDEVLIDVIRIIRSFQPDVIITRFPPEAGGTHGHHTASAQLAVEAFRLAADPGAFADRLGDLPPWQAKRLVWNAWVWRGNVSTEGLLPLEVGGYDPLFGESYPEIAARSRTMHKSQGFGAVGSRGPALEHFRLLAGEPASQDLFDGIDTTWARLPGGAAIGERVAAVIAAFDPLDPSASVPALAGIHRMLAALPNSVPVRDKQRQLDRIIAACLGLHVQTTVKGAEVVPGEEVVLRQTAIVRTKVPVTWRGGELVELLPNQPAQREHRVVIAPDAPLTHPYWLREPGTIGRFTVTDPALIGRPENPPALPIEHVFDVAGVAIRVSDEPVEIIDDPVRGEVRIPLRILPPVSMSFVEPLALFAPAETRAVTVEITAARDGQAGELRLEAPPGWRTQPVSRTFALSAAGERQRHTFELTAPAEPREGDFRLAVELGGRTYGHGRTEIVYPHLPAQLLQPEARLRAVALEVTTTAREVGYIPGAGDLVPDALRRLGCTVTVLAPDALTPERLAGFDAVVLGIRALNTQPALAARLPVLFAYAEQGGTVVMQYNTTGELPAGPLAPYPLRLSRERVTEEDAAVTFLAPDHPALNRPNRLTAADFTGWVQERGLYFAGEWSEPFEPLLSAADRGEPPRRGGLLVARHGQGWYVYTGLSFFRQLPDGVPGAYRLFANLISLGTP